MARQPNGRQAFETRPITIETGVNAYAEGSALVRFGNTHVLCTASVDNNVPAWLEGQNQGWLTAEYGMLPRSTHTRMRRERDKVSGRTQEIQRLIGRALRAMVNLKQLPGKTLVLDCDVIQADGGTRTAAITGGCVAVALALHKTSLMSAWVDTVSAVSIGYVGQQLLVDLDYSEDSTCEVDMNFVMTGAGQFIEVQGTGEKSSFSLAQMQAMTEQAIVTTAKLKTLQLGTLEKSGIYLRK